MHFINHPGSRSKEKKNGYNVNVLERTFEILEAFSQEGQEAGMMELVTKLHIPKSTVHRLILERHGYLERSPITEKYHLGSKLVQLGMQALSRLDLGSTATPHLQRLVQQTGETAHLGVLRPGRIISLFHAHGTHALRPPSTVGRVSRCIAHRRARPSSRSWTRRKLRSGFPRLISKLTRRTRSHAPRLSAPN